MYIDNLKNIIQDDAPFKDLIGKKYPSNFPKDEIEELHKINETVCNCPSGYKVKGFVVDENYNQVWEYEQKTSDEIERETASQWEKVRNYRDELLKQSDWTMLSDIPDTVNKSDWVQYRKALRDVTLQSDPFNIVYPTPPQ